MNTTFEDLKEEWKLMGKTESSNNLLLQFEYIDKKYEYEWKGKIGKFERMEIEDYVYNINKNIR